MLDRGLKPLWASDRRAAARRHGVQLLLVLDYVCELPGLCVVRVLHRWLREREPQDGRRLRARGAGWLKHGGDSMTISEWLDEAEARCVAATPGEWYQSGPFFEEECGQPGGVPAAV